MRKFLEILILSLLVLGLNGIGQASLTDGLVAYYPFNGNANDESGYGNNGTVYGASLTTDRFGNQYNAYSFVATESDTITTPLKPSNIFSLSLWYYAASSQVNNAGIASTYNVASYYGIYYICMGTSGGVWEAIRYDNNGILAMPSSSVNAWTHLVIVSNGSLIQVYKNGSLVLSFTGTTTHADTLILGSSRFNGKYFTGSIDDVYVYNRAISASEIQELYGGYVPQTCYDTGYAAGQAACLANPASCGINVNGGDAVTLTPDLKMHLPNIEYDTIFGTMSIWADLAYDGTKTDAVYFKMTGAGEN